MLRYLPTSENTYLPGSRVNRLLREPSARYREAVTSTQDDFRELSELLFGAKERYRSARATLRHTVDGAVAEESNRRFVDWPLQAARRLWPREAAN